MRLPLALMPLLLLVSACAVEDPPAPEPTPCQEAASPGGAFQAGVAEVRLPAPLGIGISGFNGLLGGPNSDSPYVARYPATTRLHGHPRFKAIAMSRGEGEEIVFLRTDMVAVPQQLRDSVIDEVRARSGRDLDQGLIMGATHTHSGPGRFIDNPVLQVIADDFWPLWYQRLVGAAADAVEAALADLSPAEFGYTIAQAPDGHNDRRCEDMVDYSNDAMPLLVVKKEGSVVGLIVNYAIHGTTIGIDDLTLSEDVSGDIEERVEDLFDHPVVAMLINSWAADMGPNAPELPGPDYPSPMPPAYEGQDRTATYLAGVVGDALPSVVTTADPELGVRSVRYPIDRANIGYGYDEFPFDWGAVYCDSPWSTCDELYDIPNLDHGCLPFPETATAPMTSVFTVGRIGELSFTTWGGEASTGLAEEVLANMKAEDGVGDVAFFGYANDYLGYTLQESDWWHGGYEASGGMWGPRQGEYMKQRQLEVWQQRDTALCGELPFVEPPPLERFDASDAVPWDLEAGIDVGVVSLQPEASYPRGEVVVASVQGNEPWLGTPTATVQRDDGAGFLDVSRPSGQPVDSDTYAMWVDITQDPPWSETVEHRDRVFTWTYSLPLDRRGTDLPAGTYRLRFSLPQDGQDPMEVTTEPFTVE